MLGRLKIFEFLFELIVTLSMFKFCTTQFVEYDKLIIEGGATALTKIFTDFNEIKETIKDLKSSIQECSNKTEMSSKYVPLFDIRYDVLPKKCFTEDLPKNCAEAMACTRRSGVYKIQAAQQNYEPFYVECDAETEGGDWTVIQRRQDGSENFLRNWEEYEKGFGDVDNEYFIGLKNLYALTNFHGPQELLIVLVDVNNTKAFAKYNSFSIGNDTEFYKLKKVGMYSGNAGDSLTTHLGMMFTTKDRDNDTHNSLNCAAHLTGAWWYNACHASNLNGKYGDNTYGKGINWYAYRGHNSSLKYVKMMIRRRGTILF